jgi:hypothetical protein
MEVRIHVNLVLIKSADTEMLGKQMGGPDVKQMGTHYVIKNDD